LSVFGQEPEKVDDFGRTSNDELSTRVKAFADRLAMTDDVSGFVKVNGPKWLQYRFIRKIEGCNRWWRRPEDLFKFILGQEQSELRVEFWSVPGNKNFVGFEQTVLDYRLPDFLIPIELTVHGGTDEYCPTYFDVEWFSKFMVANPTLRGEAVFDTSRPDFRKRVAKYRKHLERLGVEASRVKFSRSRFYHERDEQWWLIP
jgi:hypothetical protein